MIIDLYVHHDAPEGQDEINRKLDRLLEVQHNQGVLMSAAFDALKVEVEELKASGQLALDKIAELRALIEALGNAPTEEQIAEVTAAVNAVEDALEGGATSVVAP